MHARDFAEISRALMDMEWHLTALKARMGTSLPAEVAQAIAAKSGVWLTKARQLCADLGLSSVPPKIDRVLADLDGVRSLDLIIADFHAIRERIEDELAGRHFYYVPSGQMAYYQQPDLFGPTVSSKFPEAMADIEEAGNCYALNRSTACVLHLMRVLEVGIKAFAAHPKLNHTPGFRDTMGKIAGDLESKANGLTAGNQADLDEKTRLQHIAIHFKSLTGAWRNPNMHTTASYTPVGPIAEIASTERCRISGRWCRRMTCRRSMPVNSGIIRSSRTRSGIGPWWRRRIRSLQPVALSTACPSSRSASERESRMSRSSSTTTIANRATYLRMPGARPRFNPS